MKMKTNLLILVVILLSLLSSCKNEENFYVDHLDLEQKELTMMVGLDTTLRITKFYPKEPKEYELKWRSDYSSLIELDSITGKVTAKAPGDAYVQIYINNEPKGSCKIHIDGVFDAKNDVYICGFSNSQAVYWKNGIVHTLNTTKKYSRINTSAIDVYNGDVYVVGFASGNTNGIIFNDVICWKNGNQIFCSEQGSHTNYKLFVNNNNYYILGLLTDPIIQKTGLWKNGERTNFLLENGTNAHSIFVSNNDVYVAGETTYDLKRTSDTSFLDCTIAKYWKNGQEISLTDKNSVAGASDVAIVGQNVYIVGWKLENGISVAKYWKNGEEFNLNVDNEWSDAQSIVINNDDVYILGTQKSGEKYFPVYWKNGIKTKLEEYGVYNEQNEIEVAENGDVYIALKNMNCYFKNGLKVYFEKLYPDYPSISDIKVVSKKLNKID